MHEDFLHYLWKFKKFDTSNLLSVQSEQITIINAGFYHQLAGPDFFNAQLIIGDQKWAGNVEIHLKSSDWYAHNHETDVAYENVILHVVWEHDTEIYRRNGIAIPVLELRHYVSPETLQNYTALLKPKTWIFCEKQINEIDPFIFRNWQERLFFERLQKKSDLIINLLELKQNDWEAVLFCLLAKNFGLNANGDAFFEIALKIPFYVIRKESEAAWKIESLLFGFAGLLRKQFEDRYYSDLKSMFAVLCQKYNLDAEVFFEPAFFQHRPDNFPTIRLSQLASAYANQTQLFSSIIAAKSIAEFYKIFDVSATPYWQTHYQFDRESPKKRKSLSKSFIDLLIINAIVPLKFAYASVIGEDIAASLIELLCQVDPERNAVIDKFESFFIRAENAFDSQSLLQLKNEYCNKGRCLSCAVGIELLKPGDVQIV